MASVAVPTWGAAGAASMAGVVLPGIKSLSAACFAGVYCIPSFGTVQCSGYSHCMHSIVDLQQDIYH